ncbi:O-antigen ligase family protein [Salinibacter ruber]|uniref:O-antigen ligase family protein n=1 Tax=Salinibacter ruber TaxID=146919 RepID=UPI003C6EA33D
MLGVSIITLLYTGNRSGIGASTVACGYILWKGGKSKKGLVAFVLLVLLVAGYGLRGQVEALILRTDTLDTASQRTFIWEAFFEYIRNRPLLGHGWGTEDLLHDYYGSDVMEIHHTRIALAASAYIGYAAQVGLLGAAMVFFPLLWLAGRVALIPRGYQFRAHVLNSVLIAGLITATVSSWMSSLGNAQSLFFWIPVMLLVRRRVRARTQRREQGAEASPRTS